MNDLFGYDRYTWNFYEIRIGIVPSNDSYPRRADISAIGWLTEVLPE